MIDRFGAAARRAVNGQASERRRGKGRERQELGKRKTDGVLK
jgi:hypothetical protein